MAEKNIRDSMQQLSKYIELQATPEIVMHQEIGDQRYG